MLQSNLATITYVTWNAFTRLLIVFDGLVVAGLAEAGRVIEVAGRDALPDGRVGNKKPTQKKPPKKPPKNQPKKPTKNVFFCFFGVFVKFLIFYGNNTNFSL